MKYKKINDIYYIRIDKGENVTDSIIEVCERENIKAGSFQGIGACDLVDLSTWIPEKNDFIDHQLTGMLEMVSLMGNMTIGADNKPFLHSHATFSYLNQEGEIVLTGGHLKEARISYTGEIILNPVDEVIGRIFDENAGIEVWKL